MKLSDLQAVLNIDRRRDVILEQTKKVEAAEFLQGKFVCGPESPNDILEVSLWREDKGSPFGVMKRVYLNYLEECLKTANAELAALGVEP